jgi:putative transposase
MELNLHQLRAQERPFTKLCIKHNIKHILGRIHHPQTNGKIERWFGTYKIEFKEGEDNLDTLIDYYNN